MLTWRILRISLILETAVFIMILPVQFLRAGESWEKKTYTDWTASEALNVLMDSPWSKIAIVQEDPASFDTAPTPMALSNRPLPGEKCACCGPQGNAGAAGNSGLLGATPATASVPVRQVIYFRVLFFSSVKVRQALARLAQLNGESVPPQTLNLLRSPLAAYVIAVAGPFTGAFQNESLESMKASTCLRSRKRAGAKFALSGFISPNQRTDGMALFIFPRGAEGRSPFDAADEQVEFATGEGRYKIMASFRIDKMIVDGALDF
jgi:hypothetical protein